MTPPFISSHSRQRALDSDFRLALQLSTFDGGIHRIDAGARVERIHYFFEGAAAAGKGAKANGAAEKSNEARAAEQVAAGATGRF